MSPFDARFVPYLRAAEDRHFWFVARNAIIASLVSQIEPMLPSRYRVLEIGCGAGNTLKAIRGVCRRGSVMGMDLYREGLVLARDRVALPLVQGDVVHSPFVPSTRFDVIGMFDVIEHIDDDRDVLATVRSMLARDAYLLLTVPASPELWSAFDEAAGHYRRYTVNDLGARLLATGYRVDYLSPFMTALYPLAWVRRRFWHRPSNPEGAFDVARRDLRIVPIVNSLLQWALSREALRISGRARLPFGTSLIAVARPEKREGERGN
jgi:SAM-dependent methyltransferase